MRRRVTRAAASLILRSNHWSLGMTRNTLLTTIFAMTISASSVWAQRPASGTTQPQPATQTSTPIPDSRIALIYSADFRDEKTGIVRYGALMAALEREFQPRQNELNQMAQRIQQLQDETNKLQQQAGSGGPIDART